MTFDGFLTSVLHMMMSWINTFKLLRPCERDFKLIPSRSRERIRKEPVTRNRKSIFFFPGPWCCIFSLPFSVLKKQQLVDICYQKINPNQGQIETHQTLLLHIYFNGLITGILNDYQIKVAHGKMMGKIEREVCYWTGAKSINCKIYMAWWASNQTKSPPTQVDSENKQRTYSSFSHVDGDDKGIRWVLTVNYRHEIFQKN